MELLIYKTGLETPIASVKVELEPNRVYTDIRWDSKLGIVYGVLDGKKIALKVIEGNPKVQLDMTPNESGVFPEYILKIDGQETNSLTYHYWYY